MLCAVQDTIFEQSDSIWNGKNIYQFYVIKSYYTTYTKKSKDWTLRIPLTLPNVGYTQNRILKWWYTNGSETLKEMFNIFNYKEMKIKTTLTFHLTLFKMPTINAATDSRCWWGYREGEELFIALGSVNWKSQYGNSVFKQLEIDLPKIHQ